MSESSSDSSPSSKSRDDRLDSWKEIAAYLKRDITTAQRWEKREEMPVHRHLHDKLGSVYAFRTELDAWARSRHPGLQGDDPGGCSRPATDAPPDAGASPDADATEPTGRALQSVPDAPTDRGPITTTSRQRAFWWLLLAGGAVLVASLSVWLVDRMDTDLTDPVADARLLKVTDFGGTEQAGAVSRDGRFVAFLSDRDGQTDVWLTQIGTGRFHNLTHGDQPELVNPSVRTLGFSPDGALVTFWVRKPGEAGAAADISVWAVPMLGGRPRPYLEGAAEFDWSRDGSRLAYHTAEPGDPMFVRDAGAARGERRLFAASTGNHSHFLSWSTDDAFIYFVQGKLPDQMDIWRIRPSGGIPERITHHRSRVSHPVFLRPRTLAYLASDPDGSGPWLYTIDVERRTPRRVSSGIDTYTSLAASADGTRLVATLASSTGSLWRVPITRATVDASAAQRISLPTATGSCPRMGPDYMLYVSSNSVSHSIWKLQGETPTELWTAPAARIIGCPAVAPDGGRVAFSIRQNGHSLLYVMNDDGTDARIVAQSLELRGAPAWAPDGKSITSAAVDEGVPRLFRVPLDSGPPVPFVRQHSVDPAWSPDGEFVVFSGADIGTTFPVNAVTADARSYPLPNLRLTRDARHVCFLPGQRALVMLRGEIRHKNLWLSDLSTGAERRLTNFALDFDVRDFDISPDSSELVLERAQAHSDIVLLDLARR